MKFHFLRTSIRLVAAVMVLNHVATATAIERVPEVRSTSAAAAHGIEAVPMPLDPHLVTYTYDRNYTYPIFTSANKETHVEFGDDETILGVYLVDSEVEWRMAVAKGTGRDVFFTPAEDGLSQTATVITTKRRYELNLISMSLPDLAKANKNFYQRVSWQYDDMGGEVKAGGMDVGVEFTPPQTPSSQQGGNHEIEVKSANDGFEVDLSKSHFGYTVKGDAPFAPTLVLDNGSFIFIKFPDNIQSLPGPFILSKDGKAEATQFVPRDGYFMIQSLAQYGILLKLGDQEVKIFPPHSPSCGLFGCDGKSPSNLVNRP